MIRSLRSTFILALFPGSTPQLFFVRSFALCAKKAGEWSPGMRLSLYIFSFLLIAQKRRTYEQFGKEGLSKGISECFGCTCIYIESENESSDSIMNTVLNQ